MLSSHAGGVARITINRPDRRNAMSWDVMRGLRAAVAAAKADDDVRVVVLAGAGDKAFCAGADLDRLVRMMQGLRPPENEFDERIKNDYTIIYKGLLRNYQVNKPIIAAVRGFCVAGGTEILSCTDIRIAGDDARFGLAEVKWSLFPMGGSTVRLPRQISYCNAMEILLTGEQFSAERALQMGLINKVVPPNQVMPEARRYAEILNANGPLAVQAVKRSVVTTFDLPMEQALEKEMEIGVPVSMSEDCREGTKAFKEKRKPVFKGR